MAGWRWTLAALGAVAAGVLLGGCHVQGNVNVVSREQGSLDLLVRDFTFDCPSNDAGLPVVKLEPGPDISGSASCHITGDLPLANLGFSELRAVEVGEYWVFTGAFRDDRGGWPDDDVEVRFPGDVVKASQGTIRGNTLLLNPSRLTDNNLQVVVLNRPGPANWVIAAGAGAAAGVVLVLAVLVFVRWLRSSPTGILVPLDTFVDEGAPPLSTLEPDQPRPGATSEPTPVPGVMDRDWFATPPEPDAPGGGPSAARTNADGPARGQVPEEPASRPPDYSIWAPPASR